MGAGLFNEEGVKPTDKMNWSSKNAIRTLTINLILGLLVGFIVGFIVGLIGDSPGGLIGGLSYGLLGGLIGLGMLGIGSDDEFRFLLNHFLARWLLYRSGNIPCKLIDFLNYATERSFLRRVGSGYIFIHRMLMEHFAEIQEE